MLRRHARAIKATGAFLLSSGGVWVCYQVHTTMSIINDILHTNILDYGQKKVEYIYWKDLLHQSYLSSLRDDRDVTGNETMLETNVLLRWWIAAQKALAWRLLHVVTAGNKYEKQRAITSLANLKNLSDWDYQMLAQACDAQTAVGLARSEGSDMSFFLKPPKFFKKALQGKELKEKVVDMLQAMENIHHHSCLENFLSTYEHSHEDSPGMSLSPLLEDELVGKALETLAHHCLLDNNAADLLNVGALPVLMELVHYFEGNSKVLSEIFSIMSCLSAVPGALKAFHTSGWIGALAKWSRHSDASIALPCVKALANLDEDSLDSTFYPHRVFPLHPPFRSNGDHKADVIFVHGLLGTIYVTWRQRDSFKLDSPIVDTPPAPSFWSSLFMNMGWNGSSKVEDTKSETPETSHLKAQQYSNQLLNLTKEDYELLGSDFEYVLADLPTSALRSKQEPYSLFGVKGLTEELSKVGPYSRCWARDWLPNDCPNVRVLGINYTTTLSQWFPKCPNQNMKAKMADRSIEYMQMLHKVGVGTRPIIWVTHSMGGLLVKHMLISAYESENKDLHNIFRNTKAIVFFSCPHLGSEVADLKMTTEKLFWPSLEVQELRYRSAALVDLHLRFLQLLEVSRMSILSFAETKATSVTAMRLPVNFVQPHSADPGVGEFFEIPLDHIDICKPVGRHSFLYRKVIELINQVLIGQ
ncbi:protein SERAC1-like isoform X2 [Thrips palmi]|uniref:Protein SERAC1 n=1 Tax=Thrips palmi TaxID=161013 RepID=A0A6P8YFU2_THRPL|nr:protein SERAC1-like isoform X2 [Thrips palmi]